jgi:hypothetical protein
VAGKAMIDALYAIYKFITDIPVYFDLLSAFCLVALPIDFAGRLNKKYPSKIIAYGAPIVILLALLAAFAGLYQLTSYPSWIGWMQ